MGYDCLDLPFVVLLFVQETLGCLLLMSLHHSSLKCKSGYIHICTLLHCTAKLAASRSHIETGDENMFRVTLPLLPQPPFLYLKKLKIYAFKYLVNFVYSKDRPVTPLTRVTMS